MMVIWTISANTVVEPSTVNNEELARCFSLGRFFRNRTRDRSFFHTSLLMEYFMRQNVVDGDEMTFLNPRVTGLSCLRCRTSYKLDDLLEGCPACQKEGHAANVKVVYDTTQGATVREQENGSPTRNATGSITPARRANH